ncbi:hypothetical protein BABINDRAFT_162760 [Babjeviella inositovora NRRL Y-12698]|uniref:Uncharacterized protein n=1 Tax=Babjeviella inositovora NRRL Y-12698 TaxID=984486 RepID=A0A1E3QM67_9ASCO|nr:uncharacterized protein BABINDRAFT_162760 [Babjeviella inositovora NRRL Y-12698]ODQ78554.1 hypothetical protein BABINDRAFT_162760 [Babjeviella inositovora NRRL Y-12698]
MVGGMELGFYAKTEIVKDIIEILRYPYSHLRVRLYEPPIALIGTSDVGSLILHMHHCMLVTHGKRSSSSISLHSRLLFLLDVIASRSTTESLSIRRFENSACYHNSWECGVVGSASALHAEGLWFDP